MGHSTTRKKTASGETQSLWRAIAILDCFQPNKSELGVREIARQLEMSTSTVGRLLVTMHSAGILSQDPASRRYHIGPKVLTWSSVYSNGLGIRDKARPALEELHRLTNETVSIYIIDRDERVCLDRIDSPERVRVVVHLGERMPLHAGSAGKAILAFMAPDLRDQVLSTKPLERLASNTIINRNSLLKELSKVRKCGYAISHSERFEDVIGLAAPIFDAGGNVVAALNFGAPTMRFSERAITKFIPKIKQLAYQISQALGYLELPDKSQVRSK